LEQKQAFLLTLYAYLLKIVASSMDFPKTAPKHQGKFLQKWDKYRVYAKGFN
jgi:hypothetical protein